MPDIVDFEPGHIGRGACRHLHSTESRYRDESKNDDEHDQQLDTLQRRPREHNDQTGKRDKNCAPQKCVKIPRQIMDNLRLEDQTERLDDPR